MKFLCARKVIIAALVLLAAISLSGCAKRTPDDEAAVLAALHREGILAITDPQEAPRPRLAEVTRGDLIFPWQATPTVVFPLTHFAAFTITDRVWHEARIRLGGAFALFDEIEAGQFIAELYYTDNIPLEINRLALDFERDRFETWFEGEEARRQSEIAALRRAQDALTLARRELEYAQFLRDAEDRRSSFAQQEDALYAAWLGQRLYAPGGGIITHLTAAADGILFREIPYVWAPGASPGFSIMIIVDDREIYFNVDGRRDVFRFGEIYTVRSVLAGGPSFTVRVAFDPLLDPVARDGTQMITLVPDDPDAFGLELAAHGLRPRDLLDVNLVIEAPAPLAVDAVLVPAQAVHTEHLRSFVFVYDEGTLRRRYVNIGAGHGEWVQILTGLTPGQWVVLP